MTFDYEKTVFIVDSTSSALAVAIIAASRHPKSMRVIYECKEITWRKANYVALFDFLLGDVPFAEKRVIHVPHPYFIQGRHSLHTALLQRRFIRDIRTRFQPESDTTYVSCGTSSLLLSIPNRIRRILFDEGIGTLLERHSHHSRLKQFLRRRLLPFDISSLPQITLTTDQHPAIVDRLDYRDYTSSPLARATNPLRDALSRQATNILFLLHGEWHSESQREGGRNHRYYAAFNLELAREFLARRKLPGDATFFLKTHPSLGQSPDFQARTLELFREHGIPAYDLSTLIEFPEATSVPAEAILAAGGFTHLFGEFSSTFWSVSPADVVECECPLTALLRETPTENIAQKSLLERIPEINHFTGNRVLLT